jgi:hypothetical protein
MHHWEEFESNQKKYIDKTLEREGGREGGRNMIGACLSSCPTRADDATLRPTERMDIVMAMVARTVESRVLLLRLSPCTDNMSSSSCCRSETALARQHFSLVQGAGSREQGAGSRGGVLLLCRARREEKKPPLGSGTVMASASQRRRHR